VYAIGGDDGDPANAMTSVEGAQIGRFGDLGAFRTLTTELPAGVTEAQALSAGHYVYLLGGLVANATTAQVLRADVLDPTKAPVVSNLDLRFFSTPDSDPGTRDGLAPGAWTYVISAVYASADTDNPDGESLPSEPITLYAPDVPDGVEVQLDWAAAFGTGGTEAAKYRIYRTTAPNSALSELRLLAEVSSPTHTFTDKKAPLLDAQKAPLASGDLGEWRTMPAAITTARAAYGLAIATAPNCDYYLYTIGGISGASTETASYDYATIDLQTGDIGAFTQVAAAAGLTARRELTAFVADASNSKLTACNAELYAAHGHTGVATFVSTVLKTAVLAGGVLDTFTDAGPSKSLAGAAGFFSSGTAYVAGGQTMGAAQAIHDVIKADMCNGMGGCNAPDLGNYNSAVEDLLSPRYLAGFARQAPFFYLIGGADENGNLLSSSEFNVR
jgi:hypothetical protein